MNVGERGSRNRYRSWLALGLLLSAYLISPAMFSGHLEGFTAQTQSIAMLKAVDPSLQHDPYLPVVTQFIYQTRSGVVDLLSAIYRVVPDAGDYAYRALVLASLVMLVLASMVCAGRWGRMGWGWPFMALILTPGVVETAFFFNDNIVSAAFCTAALAVATVSTNVRGSLGGGLLFGAALLARVDAVLMAPVMAGVVLCASPSWRSAVKSMFWMALAVVVVLTGSALLHGFSIFDAFVTAKKFAFPINKPWVWVYSRLFFFGLVTLPMIAVGAALYWAKQFRARQFWALAALVVYPLLLALAAPKATEVRYIFPLLAPVLALHGGQGLRWAMDSLSLTGGRRWAGRLLLAFAAMVMLAPPSLLQMMDGPRYVLGRVWGIERWRDWQRAVETSFTRLGAAVRSLDSAGVNVLVTAHYNDEFFARLLLMEAGFRPEATATAFPSCGGFSVMRKGEAVVAHVRTEPQYRIAPVTLAYAAALQLDAALSCPLLSKPRRVLVSTFGPDSSRLPAVIYGFNAQSVPGATAATFDDSLERWRPNAPRRYGLLGYRELSLAERDRVRDGARHYLQNRPELDPATGRRLDMERYNELYAAVHGPTESILKNLAN